MTVEDAVRDFIASELAELEQIVPYPVEPFGYGSDLACAADLTDDVAERRGDDPLVLVEAVIRRLTCPRGALPDDASYGIDVRELLNTGISTSDLGQLAGRIRGEIEKDDRVASAGVSVALGGAASSISISVYLTPEDPAQKSFRFTLAATSAAVLLEELAA